MRTPANPTMAWAPWTDKRGHLDTLRATVFALLLLPGLWVAIRLQLGMMGPRPLNAAIHSTGYWAVSFLVASLMISPAKAMFALPGLIVVRRMVGNAALAYALIHLGFYIADENWRLWTVVREIVLRFYLTIGFVALLGLVALGATSTAGAMQRMGKSWKRLHRLTYGIAALALIHFTLQTKADISLPLLYVGVFCFLMIWRVLPAGRDRGMLAILGMTVAAAVLTGVAEWGWYRFGTNVDAVKVLWAELDVYFGLRPVGQVLALGVLLFLAQRLYIQSVRQLGQYALLWIVMFALGELLYEYILFVFGIDRFLQPGDWSWLWQDFAWAGLLACLGYVRWRCRDSGKRHAVDALGVACIAYQVVMASTGMPGPGRVFAAALALLWAIMAWRTWERTKLAAIGLVPLCAVLAYGLATLAG